MIDDESDKDDPSDGMGCNQRRRKCKDKPQKRANKKFKALQVVTID